MSTWHCQVALITSSIFVRVTWKPFFSEFKMEKVNHVRQNSSYDQMSKQTFTAMWPQISFFECKLCWHFDRGLWERFLSWFHTNLSWSNCRHLLALLYWGLRIWLRQVLKSRHRLSNFNFDSITFPRRTLIMTTWNREDAVKSYYLLEERPKVNYVQNPKVRLTHRFKLKLLHYRLTRFIWQLNF